MNVLLAPHGTRGDVQPLVALALGLRARGHDVSFLAPENAVSWIRGFGFSCESNGIDIEAMLTADGADIASFRWQMHHFTTMMVPALFDAFVRLQVEPDLIVGSGVQLAAASAAEQRGAAYAAAVFCPCAVPSRGAPPPTIRTQSLPGWLNRVLWYAGGAAVGLALRRVFNDGRARLGLAPVGNPMSHLFGSTIIVAADPDLGPLADDAASTVVMTDAWVLEEAVELDPRIGSFLDVDPPPLYVGFGSMVAVRAEELAEHAIAAARALGRPAILGGGWAGLGRHVVEADDMLMVDAVPHHLVFPRVAAVVHHGGAGTTTAAARAGVPQVILPHLLDQYYWAHRVERLGIGSRGLPVDLVNADVLTARIASALSERVVNRAAAFGPVIAARNGIADAVVYLERLIET
jgi:vancomycin aglycone glucosyltransferase